MSKHTPGPWTWIKSNCSNFVHVETDTDHMQIATCNRGNLATRQANAALIAAAPELLELAKAYQSYLEDGSKSERRKAVCLEACKTAIAKAEGNA
jgi:hypothetical protein